jgi:hypothetical protein
LKFLNKSANWKSEFFAGTQLGLVLKFNPLFLKQLLNFPEYNFPSNIKIALNDQLVTWLQ